MGELFKESIYHNWIQNSVEISNTNLKTVISAESTVLFLNYLSGK